MGGYCGKVCELGRELEHGECRLGGGLGAADSVRGVFGRDTNVLQRGVDLR